ncbi:MAG: transposase [Chloroflexi bacterium]|nr:transposase [Chloroflexota bacterium]
MMGRQAKGRQLKMFYQGFNLEQRVRPNHPLRQVKRLVDFDFIYQKVAPSYGVNGNVSVPPPVILKLMLLLVFYNVRSERELMATLPERLDWLWFIDCDLDDDLPGHSVLSKARSRWGPAAFQHFFERIVWQCVAAGLVDGAKIFLDSSLIQADAAKNSILNMNSLKSQLHRHYRELEARLEELPEDFKGNGKLNSAHLSTTDPDASLVSQGKVRSQLSFKVHRAVDEKTEIITATEVTSGAVNEGHLLPELIERHTENTQSQVEVVVADSQYGTVHNYLECHDRGLKAHIPAFKDGQSRNGKFSDEAFAYDPEDDVYLCPAGQRLQRTRYDRNHQTFQYQGKAKICQACSLRGQCTDSKRGRTLRRHRRHEAVRLMRDRAQSFRSKQDLRTRQHLMERSFARSAPYGFKRARWRRLWRVRIQEYLTAAIQNIMVLVRYVKEPGRAISLAIKQAKDKWLNIYEIYLAAITGKGYFAWAGCF